MSVTLSPAALAAFREIADLAVACETEHPAFWAIGKLARDAREEATLDRVEIQQREGNVLADRPSRGDTLSAAVAAELAGLSKRSLVRRAKQYWWGFSIPGPKGKPRWFVRKSDFIEWLSASRGSSKGGRRPGNVKTVNSVNSVHSESGS